MRLILVIVKMIGLGALMLLIGMFHLILIWGAGLQGTLWGHVVMFLFLSIIPAVSCYSVGRLRPTQWWLWVVLYITPQALFILALAISPAARQEWLLPSVTMWNLAVALLFSYLAMRRRNESQNQSVLPAQRLAQSDSKGSPPDRLKTKRWYHVLLWMCWRIYLMEFLFAILAGVVTIFVFAVTSLKAETFNGEYTSVASFIAQLIIILSMSFFAEFCLSLYMFRRAVTRQFTHKKLGTFALVLRHQEGNFRRASRILWMKVYLLSWPITIAVYVALLLIPSAASFVSLSFVVFVLRYSVVIPLFLNHLYLEKTSKPVSLTVVDASEGTSLPSSSPENRGNRWNLVIALVLFILIFFTLVSWPRSSVVNVPDQNVSAYLQAIRPINSSVPAAVDGMTDLLKANVEPSIWTDEKRKQLAGYRATINDQYEKAKVISPPSALQDFHVLWLGALEKYVQGATLLQTWPDAITQTPDIERGITLINEAMKMIDEARKRLEKTLQKK